MTKSFLICLVTGIVCLPGVNADPADSANLPPQPHSGSSFIPNTNSIANPDLHLDPNSNQNPNSNLMITPRPDASGFTPSSSLPTLTPSPLPGASLHAPAQIPVLDDPNGYGTENNWLACIITRRMVDIARLVNGATAAQGDVTVTAKVNADTHQVHVEISGFPHAPVLADLQPDFAWDGHGYAPLAATLLGPSPASGPAAVSLPDELKILQDLTEQKLAQQDLALSALLQKHPAWAAAHEQAALLLAALAIRDNAGEFSDSRRMLCRATAHLALAEALRGKEPPTWAGRIADAAIRTLAGREVDALARLDALESAADCPPQAKPWIVALRLRAKDDWRAATPNAQAPLLVKIAWFQVLSDNLSDLAVIKRFAVVGKCPPVTDWGHAVLANQVQTSVEGQNRFCKPTLEMEVAELAQSLALEGVPLNKDHTVGQQLSEPLVEQLFSGPKGELRVIGPGMFQDFSRQHLMLELRQTYWWLRNSLGDEESAEAFRKDAWTNFVGMRLAELTGLYEKGAGPNPMELHLELEEAVRKDGVTWHPWEIAAGDSPLYFAVSSDRDSLQNFYRDGMPFGTVYNAVQRRATLEWGAGAHSPPWSRSAHENDEDPLVEYMRNSPWSQAHPISDTFPFMQRLSNDPNNIRSSYPPAKDLLAMAPDSFALFACGRQIGDLIKDSRPWWDYNLVAIHRLEYYSFLLDNPTFEELLQKQVVLDPDAYFDLGDLLREEGREDEAAVADRKGFDQTYDQVNMSNRVGPLVDYYFRHSQKNQALLVAKKAAGVESEKGLLIYCDLLEKAGQLPEAAHCAEDIYSHYQDHSRLDALFAAHPDAFHDQNEALMSEIFPNGLKKVDFTSFQGEPHAGCQIKGDSTLLQEASLRNGDVIVALDSYLVENVAQYGYVRSMTGDPHMDLIIWRDSRYLKAHTSAPNRFFGVPIQNYP